MTKIKVSNHDPDNGNGAMEVPLSMRHLPHEDWLAELDEPDPSLKEKIQRAIRNQGIAYRLPTDEDRNARWIGIGFKGDNVASHIKYVVLSYSEWHSFIRGREMKYGLVGISSDFKLICLSYKFDAHDFESHEAAKEAWKSPNEWIDIAP